MLVHGGPASRDHWRFHAEAQYLAQLGIASVHVNFVGSAGFGRGFRQAGNGEWGARMQADLYEAVEAAVLRGLADPHRVCFFGSSYGGYAALLAATTQPELVRCAIASSAPVDLVSFAQHPPRFWQPLGPSVRQHVTVRADSSTVSVDELARRSPLRRLGANCAPLLLAHGAQDPKVPVEGTDRFVAAARSAGVSVEYHRFADEGHYARANHNRAALWTAITRFLEGHLS